MDEAIASMIVELEGECRRYEEQQSLCWEEGRKPLSREYRGKVLALAGVLNRLHALLGTPATV